MHVIVHHNDNVYILATLQLMITMWCFFLKDWIQFWRLPQGSAWCSSGFWDPFAKNVKYFGAIWDIQIVPRFFRILQWFLGKHIVSTHHGYLKNFSTFLCPLDFFWEHLFSLTLFDDQQRLSKAMADRMKHAASFEHFYSFHPFGTQNVSRWFRTVNLELLTWLFGITFLCLGLWSEYVPDHIMLSPDPLEFLPPIAPKSIQFFDRFGMSVSG